MSEVHKFYIKGHEVLIDKDMAHFISLFTWRLNKKSKSNYFTIRTTTHFEDKKHDIDIHRLIMNAKKGQIVDHINRNTCDNRLSNLRFCTTSENSKNTESRKNTSSKYLGVHKTKYNTYRAIICVNRKVMQQGSFKTEIEAAKAYNQAAIKYHGEFANLNKFE